MENVAIKKRIRRLKGWYNAYDQYTDLQYITTAAFNLALDKLSEYYFAVRDAKRELERKNIWKQIR